MRSALVLRSVGNSHQGRNRVETNLRVTFRIGPATPHSLGALLLVVATEPFQFAGPFCALHLVEAAQESLQVTPRQFTIGLPFHGGGGGLVTRGGHD